MAALTISYTNLVNILVSKESLIQSEIPKSPIEIIPGIPTKTDDIWFTFVNC